MDSYSEKMFLTQLFEYCKQTGVEVVPKAVAYDFCFNNEIEKGNLLYNPDLRNTAKEFMPNAKNVPNNPDGYVGSCYVISDPNKKPVLITTGEVCYLHYGIPLGEIKYSADIKGNGKIEIFAIKNSDSVELNDDTLMKLSEMNVSQDDYRKCSSKFFIPDNEETAYEQLCEGLGEKIMGIKIVYSSGLKVKNINIKKIADEE